MRKLLFWLFLSLLSLPAVAADSTVSALTGAGALTGAELFYCVQSAADRKCTISQIPQVPSLLPVANGYYPSNYAPDGAQVAGAALAAGTIYLLPTYLPVATYKAMGYRATTGDTSSQSIILALYATDATNTNRPGALVANSALAGTAMVGTAIPGSVPFVSNFSVTTAGVYWLAAQLSGSTTVRLGAFGANGVKTIALLGSQTLANSVSTPPVGLSTTGVFGTLPALGAATFTEVVTNGVIPSLSIQVASVP